MIQLKQMAVREMARANAGLYAVDRNQCARQGCVSRQLVRKRLISEVIDAHARVLTRRVLNAHAGQWGGRGRIRLASLPHRTSYRSLAQPM